MKYDIFYLMDPELKKLLEDNLTLNKENNFLLNKLYNFYKINLITNILKWIVVVGVAIGAFYFVQPFLDNIFNLYNIDSLNIESLLK